MYVISRRFQFLRINIQCPC